MQTDVKVSYLMFIYELEVKNTVLQFTNIPTQIFQWSGEKEIFLIMALHCKIVCCNISSTVNVLKFRTPCSFSSIKKCWLSGLEFTKCMSEWQTGKTLVRLLLRSSLI